MSWQTKGNRNVKEGLAISRTTHKEQVKRERQVASTLMEEPSGKENRNGSQAGREVAPAIVSATARTRARPARKEAANRVI